MIFTEVLLYLVAMFPECIQQPVFAPDLGIQAVFFDEILFMFSELVFHSNIYVFTQLLRSFSKYAQLSFEKYFIKPFLHIIHRSIGPYASEAMARQRK